MGSELMQGLWSLPTNPNVIYILLIVGLWAATAALYVPGTGLLEVAAAICLALAIMGLTQVPFHVVGLLLLVVAGLLFVIDLKVRRVVLTVGAAVSLVLGSVFLFPWVDGAPSLSPWLIGGASLASFGFFGVTLSAAIRSQRLRAKVAAETIVGRRGLVMTPIDPVGTVQIESELWTALATEPIGAGEEVEVVALEGLRAHVVRAGSTEQRRQ